MISKTHGELKTNQLEDNLKSQTDFIYKSFLVYALYYTYGYHWHNVLSRLDLLLKKKVY